MRRGAGSAGRGVHPALLLVIFISLFSAAILPGICSAVPVTGNTSAENLTATFFYSEHCIACTKALPVADRLATEYPSVSFVNYNVWNSTENESLFFSFGEAYGIPYPRYPTVFLSDGSFFEGYGAISTDLPLHLASPTGVPAVTEDPVVADVTVNATDPPLDPVVSSPANVTVVPATISLPPVGLVIAAGLIDGINPCAVAVLIFLLLTLAGAGGRAQMLRFGAAYVAGIYLIYFLAGFGLLAAVRVSGFSGYFSCVAGVIALLLGMVMVADSFRQDGESHSPHLQLPPRCCSEDCTTRGCRLRVPCGHCRLPYRTALHRGCLSRHPCHALRI
ncbi:hypothetical protein [Methanogenium cariaci]|jgi:thiol-disulfide isomerase/thioredoxin